MLTKITNAPIFLYGDKKMDMFIKQLKDEVAKLENERLIIERKIRALKTACETYISDDAIVPEKPDSVKNGKESKMDIMVRILKEAGKSLHYKEITNAVEEAGYPFGKNKIGAVTATLSRSKRFKRTKPGFYTLSKERNPETKE